MDDKKRDSKKSWRGSWDRPVTVDESSYDPLTIARMSDHNVRGNDRKSETTAAKTTDVTKK